MIAADELVAFLVEQIALDGAQGCSIDLLWDHARVKTEQLDDSLKSVVWNWLLLQREQVVVCLRINDKEVKPLAENEEDLTDLASLTIKYGDSLRLSATEDWLWQTLTGSRKEESPIGNMPFVLLCAITRAREEGINAIDLARITEQDPRSLFNRIKMLVGAGLIKRYTVVLKKYGVTALLVSSKFAQARQAKNANLDSKSDRDNLRQSIMSLLKAAKNGIRQRHDLRKQLSLDNSRENVKLFQRVLRSLEDKGCIRRVDVVRASDATGQKHPCIQFVKDFDQKKDDEEIFQEVADDNNDIENLSDIEDLTQETFELGAEDSIHEVVDNTVLLGPNFNRFYPIENQIYDLVDSAGASGISSMDLTSRCVGIDFNRIFSAVLSKLADSSGNSGSGTSQPGHLGQYALVRGTDTKARVTYYRYFTLPSYRKFTHQLPDDHWGDFGPLPATPKVFRDLASLSRKPNGDRNVPDIHIGVNAAGQEEPFWHGSSASITKVYKKSDKPAKPAEKAARDPNKPKLGRPRKNAINTVKTQSPAEPASSVQSSVAQTENLSISSTPVQVAMPTTSSQIGQPSDDPVAVDSTLDSLGQTQPIKKSPDAHEAAAKDSKKKTAFSIAASQRQSAILKLLDENGGVMEGGRKLLDILRSQSEASSSGLLDSRTLKRDINTLTNQNKLQRLCIVTGDGSTLWVITYPEFNLDSPEVHQFTADRASKDPPKRVKSVEVISNEFSFYLIAPQTKKQQLHLERRAEKAVRSTTLSKAQRQAASARLKERALENASRPQGISLITVSSNRQEPQRPLKLLQPIQARKNPPRTPSADVDAESSVPSTASIAVLAKPVEQSRKRARSETRAGGPANPFSEFVPRGKKPKTNTSAEAKKKRSDMVKDFKRSSRRTRSSLRLGHKQVDDIFRAVVITRSFYGGLSKTIDWNRVSSTLGGQFTVAVVHSVWPRIRQFFGGSRGISKAADRWERIFLDAYEADKFPGLDLENIDVMDMVRYWRENEIDVIDDENSVEFLASIQKESSPRDYSFVRDEPVHTWIDEVYMSLSTVRSEEVLTSVPFSAVQDEPGLDALFTHTQVDDVKQLVKSIIATDEATYAPQVAKELLDKFGTQLCARAVNQMEKEKAIIYTSRDLDSRVPGRNFTFSDRFNLTWRLRTEESSFQKACSFHNRLLSAFTESKGIIMSRLAPDSSMICLMDLIARKQVDLVRVNVNAGKLIEGYTSRLVDREKLDCDIVLRSNADDEVRRLPFNDVAIPGVHDPESPDKLLRGGRMWIDVNGNINQTWFQRFVNIVVMTIALRPGIPVAELCRKFHVLLTAIEMKDILSWIVRKDLVELVEERGNGYWVKEGWYHTGVQIFE